MGALCCWRKSALFARPLDLAQCLMSLTISNANCGPRIACPFAFGLANTANEPCFHELIKAMCTCKRILY